MNQVVEVRLTAEAAPDRDTPGGFGAGGADRFEFTLSGARDLTVLTLAADGGCPGDTRLRLLDPDGRQIGFDDDSGEGLCARLDGALPAGTYQVEVDGYEGAAVPAYALSIQASDCAPNCPRAAWCGNGQLDPGETCDAGDRAIGDGCGADCRSEPACPDGAPHPCAIDEALALPYGWSARVFPSGRRALSAQTTESTLVWTRATDLQGACTQSPRVSLEVDGIPAAVRERSFHRQTGCGAARIRTTPPGSLTVTLNGHRGPARLETAVAPLLTRPGRHPLHQSNVFAFEIVRRSEVALTLSTPDRACPGGAALTLTALPRVGETPRQIARQPGCALRQLLDPGHYLAEVASDDPEGGLIVQYEHEGWRAPREVEVAIRDFQVSVDPVHVRAGDWIAWGTNTDDVVPSIRLGAPEQAETRVFADLVERISMSTRARVRFWAPGVYPYMTQMSDEPHHVIVEP